MTLTIRVYSDYVCPYCILAEGQLEAAAAERGVEIEHMPFELRPYPTPTLRPEDDYMQNDWRDRVFPLADQLGVKMVMPPFSPQPYTHLAFEGYQYAKAQGKEAAHTYNSRMYKAFFQDSLDIGNIDVLTRLAGEIGLNREEYRTALESRKYQEAHQRALKHAYEEMGIRSAPTFAVGHTVVKWLLYKEQFLDLIDTELRRQSLAGGLGQGPSCSAEGCD